MSMSLQLSIQLELNIIELTDNKTLLFLGSKMLYSKVNQTLPLIKKVILCFKGACVLKSTLSNLYKSPTSLSRNSSWFTLFNHPPIFRMKNESFEISILYYPDDEHILCWLSISSIHF